MGKRIRKRGREWTKIGNENGEENRKGRKRKG